jgi:hypothetical protein
METFTLTLLFKIIGIGAASGLWYQNDELYLISDNSTYLYHYKIASKQLHKIPLVNNPQENIPKKEKPDLEAITAKRDQLVIIGSGSTQQRNRIFTYKLHTKETKQKDWTALFSSIQTELNITPSELNIEGIILQGENIYLFQRGNGVTAKNGIIKLRDNISDPLPQFYPITLPTINGITASFTDAVLVEDTIYFLAAAEDSNSTFHDGTIAGSMIGTIDSTTLTLKHTEVISLTHKFEGLTFYKKENNTLELLLCEDPDSEDLETNIYHLVIPF